MHRDHHTHTLSLLVDSVYIEQAPRNSRLPQPCTLLLLMPVSLSEVEWFGSG